MLLPPSRKKIKLENVFAPRSPLEFLGFALITIIINLVSSGNEIAIGGVLFIFLLWWFIDYQRSQKLAKTLAFVPDKQPPEAAKGLILLLSPYTVRNLDITSQQLKRQIEYIRRTPYERLKITDFDKINIGHSNLLPQIKAVEYHLQQGKLRDVWLISTASYDNVKGSVETAQILEKYLRCKYGQRLDVYSRGLIVKDWDYRRLWQLGEQIFQNSDLQEEAIVVDITGGTKMMSVALAMACIPRGRQMQYMDSQRDWQGNPLPAGEIRPILIDVNPMLYSW